MLTDLAKNIKHYSKQWTGENLDLVMAEFQENIGSENINKTQGANSDEDQPGGRRCYLRHGKK